MTGEFVAWCVGGAVCGAALGTVLARPAEAFNGLRDAFVEVGALLARGLQHLRRGAR